MENLGLDGRLLGFQIFNFVVILFLLNKLIFQPLSKKMDERKTLIEKGLAKEGEVGERLAQIEFENQETMLNAKKEIDKMMAEAAVKAKEIKSEIMEGAKKESEELIKETKEKLAGEREEMVLKAKGEVADLAIEAVKSILGSEEADQLKDNLNKKAINKLWQKSKTLD